MCKMSNYIHKMLLNTRGTASIVFLVYRKIEIALLRILVLDTLNSCTTMHKKTNKIFRKILENCKLDFQIARQNLKNKHDSLFPN